MDADFFEVHELQDTLREVMDWRPPASVSAQEWAEIRKDASELLEKVESFLDHNG